MPRVSVITQKITRTGLNVTMTAPIVDGDIIDSGPVILTVANASASALTVTFQTPLIQDDLGLADLIVTVPVGGTREIGPFPGRSFAQSNVAPIGPGRVLVDYSSVVSVTRSVKSL